MALTLYSFSLGAHFANRQATVVQAMAGSSIQKGAVSIYSDAAGQNFITQPTTLDANGNLSVYAVVGTYAVIVPPKL